MATIDDLNISITRMESSALIKLIQDLRRSRRTKKILKMTTRSHIKAGKNPKEIFDSAPVSQKKDIIAALEEMMK